jgi:hypothetical protein
MLFSELTSSLGPWTKEEEEQLIGIVTKMTVEQGKDIDNEVFWGRVSEEMGGKRGRQQCRIKWYVGVARMKHELMDYSQGPMH